MVRLLALYLRGFGSPPRLQARLAQPLGPEAPALGPQPHVLPGVRDQRLMFFGDSLKRFEARAGDLQFGNDRPNRSAAPAPPPSSGRF